MRTFTVEPPLILLPHPHSWTENKIWWGKYGGVEVRVEVEEGTQMSVKFFQRDSEVLKKVVSKVYWLKILDDVVWYLHSLGFGLPPIFVTKAISPWWKR